MKTAILAFLYLATVAFAETPISLQQLPTGDKVKVTFSSSGCFHRYTYEFEFQRSTTITAKVRRLEDRWNDSTQKHETIRRISLGTATLTPAELAGLDRLLAFYRSKRGGACTTVDQITLQQTSGTAIKATESYTDATCASYTFANRGFTSFPSIAKKVDPKAP